MEAKVRKNIIFSLLITSILALIVISMTFKYSTAGETFLLETDLDLNMGESIAYNGSLFVARQHIYKISVSGIKAKYDPLLDTSVVIFVNGVHVGGAKGPTDTYYYNEAYVGKIEELVFTDAGLGVTGHVEISAVIDMNPVYISLAVVICVLSLYYLYINVNNKISETSKEEIVEL